MEDYINEERYLRAKQRVDRIKGYYWHLASYVIVNTFISVSKIVSNMSDGESFSDAFFDFGTFAVWLLWGIGLLFHTLGVFGKDFFLGKDWEQRKIKEFMEQEKSDQNWK